jgi:hypothetical protein
LYTRYPPNAPSVSNANGNDARAERIPERQNAEKNSRERRHRHGGGAQYVKRPSRAVKPQLEPRYRERREKHRRAERDCAYFREIRQRVPVGSDEHDARRAD